VRARWDVNQDTPFQAETPAGANPPDGAIIYYYLKSGSPAENIKLEIHDKQGHLVRSFSHVAESEPKLPANAPEYWFAKQPSLSKNAGLNRFAWDLCYPHPETLPYSYYGNLIDYVEYTLPDHAIPGETPRYQPPGPLVAPGEYEVALTVDGKTYRQTVTVKSDPRVKATQSDLDAQLAIAESIARQMQVSASMFYQVHDLRAMVAERKKALAGDSSAGDAKSAIDALHEKLGKLESGKRGEPGFGMINRDQARLITMVESADVRPSQTAEQTAEGLCSALNKDLAAWREVNQKDIPSINALLEKYKVGALKVAAHIPAEQQCGS
ncbi:MAG: hypothetical protein ACREDR_39400, partial [Blastocatellia bacterium]